MRKKNISSGILRLCAAVVIAMVPLQVSFAKTYHYENSTNYDSELYVYSSSEQSDTSSWRTRWEQRSNHNGNVEVRSYSAAPDDTTTSDWRSRWSSKNNDRRDELSDDINNFRDDFNDDVSDWRTRWVSKVKKERNDWNNEVQDWRDKWRGDGNNGHGNDDDHCDESNPGNNHNNRDCDDNDGTATRAEAQSALNRAQNTINDLESDIEEMEDDDEDQDDIDEARDVLDAAQDRLDEAREHFTEKEYEEAKDAAEDAIDIIEEYRDDTGNGGTDVPEACMLSDTQLNRITNFPSLEDGPIVAFGDSLTAGVGASSGQDYVSELEALIGEDIINAGVRGDTTEEALARLDEDVLSRDPRAVIVWLGGNDVLARYFDEIEERAEDDSIWENIYEAVLRLFGREPNNSEVLTEDETFDNLTTIVERIQDSGAVVILVGIDGEPLDNNLSERYEEIADETGAIYVDDVLRGIIGRSSLTSDFIHPNNAGYEIVAERIFPAIACIVPDLDDTENTNSDSDQRSNTGSDWRTRWQQT